MSRRAGCDSLGSRSERLRNVRANQLPKQQLPADGSVFLIRLLQLWMVHSNQAARHPPANAAYHTLAGEEEEEREEVRRKRRGKRRGKERIKKTNPKDDMKKRRGGKRKEGQGEEMREKEKRRGSLRY